MNLFLNILKKATHFFVIIILFSVISCGDDTTSPNDDSDNSSGDDTTAPADNDGDSSSTSLSISGTILFTPFKPKTNVTVAIKTTNSWGYPYNLTNYPLTNGQTNISFSLTADSDTITLWAEHWGHKSPSFTVSSSASDLILKVTNELTLTGTVNAPSGADWNLMKIGLFEDINEINTASGGSGLDSISNVTFYSNNSQTTNALNPKISADVSGSGTSGSFTVTLPPSCADSNYILIGWYDHNTNGTWDVVDYMYDTGHSNSEFARLPLYDHDDNSTTYAVHQFWQGGFAQSEYIFSATPLSTSTTPLTGNLEEDNLDALYFDFPALSY